VYYAAFAIFVAGVLTYYFARYLHNTAEMIAVIAAVFSILAGVLIAVVSILGDPGMLMDQSWRYNYLASKEIQRKLHRNIDIFVLYIVILIALFIFAMITDKASKFYAIMQGTMFFLCAVGFFASVSLPFSLVRIQRDRLDAAIKSAKSKTPTP
jgi:cytochrome bd-type quinol oxidase subunit 2